MPTFNPRKWQGFRKKWVSNTLYQWNPRTKRYNILRRRSAESPPFSLTKWQGFRKKWVSNTLYQWNPRTKRYNVITRKLPRGVVKKKPLSPQKHLPKSRASTPRKRLDTSRISTYQGSPRFSHSNQLHWRWDKTLSRYVLHSRSVVNHIPTHVSGIRFTFFAAQGVYPKRGRAPPLDRFFSNGLLHRQLFLSTDNQKLSEIRPSDFDGRVPLTTLFQILNSILGVSDFRREYANWSYRYEVGSAVYAYDKNGKRILRKIVDKGSTRRGASGHF